MVDQALLIAESWARPWAQKQRNLGQALALKSDGRPGRRRFEPEEMVAILGNYWATPIGSGLRTKALELFDVPAGTMSAWQKSWNAQQFGPVPTTAQLEQQSVETTRRLLSELMTSDEGRELDQAARFELITDLAISNTLTFKLSVKKLCEITGCQRGAYDRWLKGQLVRGSHPSKERRAELAGRVVYNEEPVDAVANTYGVSVTAVRGYVEAQFGTSLPEVRAMRVGTGPSQKTAPRQMAAPWRALNDKLSYPGDNARRPRRGA